MAPLPMEARTTTGRFLASHPKQIVRAVAFTAGILAAACSQAASNAPVPAHLLGIAPAPDRERYSILYSLGSGYQGLMPQAGLVAYDGTLYGTTPFGGNQWGNVFTVSPTGSAQVLYAFTSQGDPEYPMAGLLARRGEFSEPALEKNVCVELSRLPDDGSGDGVSISQRQTPRDDAWRRIKRGRSRF